MKVGILSDIHSNSYALKAVLNQTANYAIEKFIILGDIFGYYPWAAKTFELLLPILPISSVIKGNHDQLVINQTPPYPVPSYWGAAKQNEIDLLENFPEAIDWLKKLNFSEKLIIDTLQIQIHHGTPDDPENGRYYPTELAESRSWYPKADTAIFLGHTHYPFAGQSGRQVYNPGSVGQPRDGNPMPSWGIFDTTTKLFTLMRSEYDNLAAMAELAKLNWNTRSIEILNKKSQGAFIDKKYE